MNKYKNCLMIAIKSENLSFERLEHEQEIGSEWHTTCDMQQLIPKEQLLIRASLMSLK